VTGGHWPYGASAYLDVRQRMFAWAEDRGLKLAHPRDACPFWLLSGKCECLCPTWIDHPSAWHAGAGQGRVLVAHSYGLSNWADYLDSMLASGFDITISAPVNDRDAEDAATSARLPALRVPGKVCEGITGATPRLESESEDQGGRVLAAG
jgi:hypothetical protein